MFSGTARLPPILRPSKSHRRNSHPLEYACIYSPMEFRQLGRSGLKVPALSFGTGTFGGGTEFFRAWGASDVAEATRLVDICMEAGVNLFDTADVYSNGLSEEILGQGHQRTPPGCPDLDQDHVPPGQGSERRGIVAPSYSSGLRSQPAPPRHRLYRHLPSSRIRRAHSGRGSSEQSQPPGRERQSSLHRLLQFFRLAPDEISRRLRSLWLVPLRGAPGLLFADRQRIRMGTHAARPRSRRRRSGLEPAGMGTSDGKDSSRPTHTRRQPAPPNQPITDRRWPTSICTKSWTRWSR